MVVNKKMTTSNKQILTSENRTFPVPGNDMVGIFEKNCSLHPEKVIYYFLEDGINEADRITFSEMNTRVKAVAAALQSKLSKGDRALMLFPSGIEFIVSLFGCFYSGIIGVPAYPPRKNRLFERFEAIVKDCTPSIILTTSKIRDDIRKNFAAEECLQNLDILVYEDIVIEMSTRWQPIYISPDDLALLQYTSGSTGTPNGVMVSHFNIIQNSEYIRQAFGHVENTLGVNWLPGFHDMGLIGALMQPPYMGVTNAIIPPNSFLLRPMNWLAAISKYRATTAGGPNFALDFCVERLKPEELEGVDLSSVRPFFCGAEPIRRETFERFTKAFEPYRFNPSQLYPCYGLAESVLIVTGGALDDEPVYCTVDAREIEKGRVLIVPENHPHARTFVSCGYPWQGTQVCIVDPSSCSLNPILLVGEIWVSGPSIAQGYWNKPGETEKTFRAYLADTAEGPFLRTGDLGFIHEGHLYISGRIKDLIIIRGLNHYPQDIEHSAGLAHEAIQPGAVAAFSVDEAGEERLGIVCEIRRTHLRDLDADAVFTAIRQAVAENHQLQVHAIALIRTGTLPKTSSGKIQRLAAKKEFLHLELELLSTWKVQLNQETADRRLPTADCRPSTADLVSDWLIAWMVKELKISGDNIDVTKPITSYGLDSLKAVILARDAEDYFGIEWPLELFLEETTVKNIAEKGEKLINQV
jgi:acyl-CoA synthetase (AMP-forming)/AMP-acid ligase II/acyl carrier protein